MIIKGGSRKSAAFFAKHLMKTEENERVAIVEMKGLYADDLKEAFREMRLVAAGTRAENYFYHASINPREDERLTPEQWETAVNTLERNLNLEGHARFQVEHEKEGRTHRHIVWSRVDPDTMTVTPASDNYLAHDKTRAELEQEFHHEPTPSTPEPSKRKSREIEDWENFRAQESGIDPKQVKAEVTQLWKLSDSGRAFQSALEERGYVLCKGDQRDFCLVDAAGDVHSLGRRIEGVKAAEIRARLADIDRDSLMTVKEASAWVKEQDSATGSDSVKFIQPESAEPATLIAPDRSTPDHPAQTSIAQEGEPSIVDPRAAWFADNLPDTYPAAVNLSEHATLIETDMRRNDCELPLAHGRTWEIWADHAMHYFRERASSLSEKVQETTRELQDKLTQVKDRLSTFWQDFIKEGREREPPEIQQPERER